MHDNGVVFSDLKQVADVGFQYFAVLADELNQRDHIGVVSGMCGAKRTLFARGMFVASLFILDHRLRIGEEEYSFGLGKWVLWMDA